MAANDVLIQMLIKYVKCRVYDCRKEGIER